MPGGRILVIDDDQTVLRSVGEVLQAEGFAVECCADAGAALEAVAGRCPDLILLELMLPGMNGRQFLRVLRQGTGGAERVPVVLMTAVRGIDARQTLSMGACDLIEKPFDDEVLLDKVALALFRAHGERQPGWQPAVEPGEVHGEPGAAPDGPEVILLITHDPGKVTRLEPLFVSRGLRLVPLVRVSDELLRLARVLEPRVILIDLHIPDDGGLIALRQLRAEPALVFVPVVVLSDDEQAIARVRPELLALVAVGLCAPSDSVLVAQVAESLERAGMV